MKYKTLLLFAFIAFSGIVKAVAQDVEGSSDYPLFSRIPGFSIKEFTQEDEGIYTFYSDQDNEITLRGKKTTIYYVCNCEESPLRIIRDFSTSARKLGGKSLEYSDNRVYIMLKRDGKEIWAEVYAGEYYYYLTIVEKEEIIAEITAVSLLNQLKETGKLVLYLDFYPGKPLLRPETKPVTDKLIRMMNQDPLVAIVLNDYTCSESSAQENLRLSEKRAQTLKDILVSGGIDAKRIKARGLGENTSLSDDTGEYGKYLNSRVELTLQH